AENAAAGVVLDKYRANDANVEGLDGSFSSSIPDKSGTDSKLDEELDEEVEDEEDEDSELDIDQMLEAPIPGRPGNGQNRQQPQYREKLVLKHRSTEYFEVLPDGWIEITHRSGMPVYLHKASRVCVFSRPYFLGPGSVRNHEVPLAAIPCLHQKRMREMEEEK